MPSEDDNQNLFSYGTLQEEGVQLATFGRKLEGTPDILIGYYLALVETKDAEFIAASGAANHRNAQRSGVESDVIKGTVFKVTPAELATADAYEPFDYKRVLVQLGSGLNAWIFVNSSATAPNTEPG
jgi:Gamma-glutamyl cyclotransferase, AIG2-like